MIHLNPLDSLLESEPLEQTYLRWGAVTDDSPLTVQLDQDTAPSIFEPSTIAGPHSVGQRVLVALAGRRAIILGVAS